MRKHAYSCVCALRWLSVCADLASESCAPVLASEPCAPVLVERALDADAVFPAVPQATAVTPQPAHGGALGHRSRGAWPQLGGAEFITPQQGRHGPQHHAGNADVWTQGEGRGGGRGAGTAGAR